MLDSGHRTDAVCNGQPTPNVCTKSECIPEDLRLCPSVIRKSAYTDLSFTEFTAAAAAAAVSRSNRQVHRVT